MEEIVHYFDSEAEGLYHLLCKRPWVGTKAWTPPDKRALGMCTCSDGTYMSDKPELITCPICKSKLQ